MAVLYEYYNTGDDDDQPVGNGGNYKCSQSFTPSITHIIKSIKIRAWRQGTLTGTFTVNICSTSQTGTVLATGTYDASSLTTSSPGDWIEITLGAGATLTASTKYWITLIASYSAGNSVRWRFDITSPSYAGGNALYTSDGTTWTDATTKDFMFEEYGPDITSFFNFI